MIKKEDLGKIKEHWRLRAVYFAGDEIISDVIKDYTKIEDVLKSSRDLQKIKKDKPTRDFYKTIYEKPKNISEYITPCLVVERKEEVNKRFYDVYIRNFGDIGKPVFKLEGKYTVAEAQVIKNELQGIVDVCISPEIYIVKEEE